MKNFLPPLKIYLSGTVAILLLSGCSSPTKYTPRAPVATVDSAESSKVSVIPFDAVQVQKPYSDPNPCGDLYQVQSRDSLSEIALRCQVPMKSLAEWNKIPPPYVIYKNQRLEMPNLPTQQVKSTVTVTNTSEKKSIKNPVVVTESSHQKEQPSQLVKHQIWQWPVHKSLPYRFVRDEAGLSVIDIYGVAGQDVYAVASGSVVYAGDGIVDFGNMLVIKHDDGYMAVYAHNSALLVQEGDRVKVGQHIADLGATGNASQPKLYLEARFKGRKIDILKVLTVPKSN
ncbi:MAG: peptidoglycan DD-metalloendopeptidase family protein [Thiomicrorhabdus sp.]|nr:peptidoglycan DD-metalloendopeptidase family protein [Thiomicrorhabdus sp.]